MEITIAEFREILRWTQVWAENVHWNYSGRGMFGDTCPGVTLSSIQEFGVFMVAATIILGSERAEELSGRTVTDSMGLGSIYYWPGVTLV